MLETGSRKPTGIFQIPTRLIVVEVYVIYELPHLAMNYQYNQLTSEKNHLPSSWSRIFALNFDGFGHLVWSTAQPMEL